MKEVVEVVEAATDEGEGTESIERKEGTNHGRRPALLLPSQCSSRIVQALIVRRGGARQLSRVGHSIRRGGPGSVEEADIVNKRAHLRY